MTKPQDHDPSAERYALIFDDDDTAAPKAPPAPAAKPAPAKPAPAKPAPTARVSATVAAEVARVRAGEMSFREAEGEMVVTAGLAYRPAADRLPRNVPIAVEESTDSAVERAVLAVVGLEGVGRRIKNKAGEVDVSGIVNAGGGRVLDSAVRRRWERQPTLATMAHQITRQIQAERRETITTPCSQLYLGKDGSLYLQGHKPPADGNVPHRLSATAYSQIAERGPVKKPLAYNVNAWAPRSDKAIRTRRLQQPNKPPLVFAAVGPKYVEFDCDRVIGELSNRLPADARARWTYGGDGGNWRIEATLARDPQKVAGDLHELGLWLASSDDGRSGLRFGYMATRWTCSNGLRIHHQATTRSLRHVGNVERFLEQFEKILGLAGDAWAVFHKAWEGAAHARPIDAETGEPISVEDAVVRLVAAKATDRYRLSVPGVSAEQMAGRVLTSWQEEPEDNVRGLVNAITRASHEWQWKPSSWADDDLEEQASELLYARVIELPSYAAQDHT